MTRPCKNCQEQAAGCQAGCEKLRRYDTAMEARRKYMARERLLDSFAAQSAFAANRVYHYASGDNR